MNRLVAQRLRLTLQMLRDRKGDGEGFTLLEAIITIGILLVLASIAIPAYNDYVTSAREARTAYNASATAVNNSYAASLSAATAP